MGYAVFTSIRPFVTFWFLSGGHLISLSTFLVCSKNDSNVNDEGTSTDAGIRGKHTGLQQGDTDPSIPGSDHKTAEGDKVKKREELDLKRLCNGEIFFIENVSTWIML